MIRKFVVFMMVGSPVGNVPCVGGYSFKSFWALLRQSGQILAVLDS